MDQINGCREDILNLYKDGIAGLKQYELHPAFHKKQSSGEGAGSQYLIDIYYAESSMNNFKQNCVSQLDRITTKVATLKKEFVTKFGPIVKRHS